MGFALCTFKYFPVVFVFFNFLADIGNYPWHQMYFVISSSYPDIMVAIYSTATKSLGQK